MLVASCQNDVTTSHSRKRTPLVFTLLVVVAILPCHSYGDRTAYVSFRTAGGDGRRRARVENSEDTSRTAVLGHFAKNADLKTAEGDVVSVKRSSGF